MHQLPTADGVPAFTATDASEQHLPIVLNLPHSGSSYSESFLAATQLNRHAIRASEDVGVDELFAPAAALGAPLLRAHFPRAWLDVNREPYELDPDMFAGPLPAHANTRSIRVSGGLGAIPRIVSESVEIYGSQLPVSEAINRLETVYKPYHRALARLIARTVERFGVAVLLDCHSMPSAIRGSRNHRPDIVLGDRYRTSCASDLTDLSAALLAGANYRVTCNKPYAGGYITEHYGAPTRNVHALQIEINRSLYVNERTLQPTSGFARVQRDMAALTSQLGEAIASGLLHPAQAAE
ncbi:MAG: N-formylglutamate amidohydrolase [Alphaproteobacteria bacterium]